MNSDQPRSTRQFPAWRCVVAAMAVAALAPSAFAQSDRFLRLMAEQYDALDKQRKGSVPASDLQRMLKAAQ